MSKLVNLLTNQMFQHTAARRRLKCIMSLISLKMLFQHTAARRRLVFLSGRDGCCYDVSTHSRPKAAVLMITNLSSCMVFQHTAARRRLFFYYQMNLIIICFNTQPPEGGWASLKSLAPSSFTALISLSSQERRKCEYNIAFSVTLTFAIS